MDQGLQPLPGFALVRLPKQYESGLSTEKEKFAERTRGFMEGYTVDSNDINELERLQSIYEYALGAEVYFTPYVDGSTIKVDDEEFVFVPLKELRGCRAKA
ncbi:hypothetical protein CQ476_26 [TM7 phage DolZOral124_53_65]|nr:hypothetical protein CQ476_26 [TM7 phage DolZOral124_53_65]